MWLCTVLCPLGGDHKCVEKSILSWLAFSKNFTLIHDCANQWINNN